MIDRFEIVTSGSVRPQGAERILFCDGTGGGLFRDGSDLELSHWRPNTTPAEFRAGTSTEICFRFLEKPRPGPWTVAVNNHIDVDGILSVYVLIHSRHAVGHRQTIIEAAEMGDFWGWGETPAQRLFQGLTLLMEEGGLGQATYETAFQRIPGFIDGTDQAVSEIDKSLEPLRVGCELVTSRKISRQEKSPRLVHYIVPRSVAGDDDERASKVPEFNEAISTQAILWPQVRARWDAQRVCLVSTERPAGWFHDLWFPGYLWADTEGKWAVPGMAYHDGMGGYSLANPRLTAAIDQLQRHESASGQWGLGGTSLPFGVELQQRFPLVSRFLDEQGRAASSHQSPDPVAQVFAGVFA